MERQENNEEKNTTSETSSPWSGLSTRIVSAVVLASVFVAVLWQGGWLFNLLILIAAMLMVKEWNTLTANEDGVWRAAGLLYSAIPCASLIWLRDIRLENAPDLAGVYLVLFLILIVSATDIGAYFTGRKFGKNKLAPVISPNKTWEGLGGGVLLAALVGGFGVTFTPFSLFNSVILSVALAVVAQGGDLFESWMKRRAGIKDSGTLIPGHGGLLDRVDGLVFTAPLYAWCVYLSGKIL